MTDTLLRQPPALSGIAASLRPRRLPALSLAVVAATAMLVTGCSDDDHTVQQAARHLSTSQAYTEQGQYRAALIEAHNALRQVPGDRAAALQLARIQLQLGNARNAAQLLEPLSSDDPEVAQLLARAWVEQAKYRSATELLRQTDLSDAPEARVTLARGQAGLGHHEEAQQTLRQVMEQHPELDEAYIALARVQLARHRPDEATATLEQLLRRNPNHAEALLLRAMQARAEEDLDSTDRYLSEALSNLPQSDLMTPLKASVLSALADTLNRLGRPAEAMVYSRMLAEADPEASEARKELRRALEHMDQGDLDSAEQILARLNADHPGHSHSATLLGLINFQQGDYDQAGELLNEHVDPETSSPQVIIAAALTHLATAPDQARQLVADALAFHEDHAALNALYGSLLTRQPGREEEGLARLDRALELAPDQPRLRLPRAAYYASSGQLNEARQDLMQAAKDDPADASIQNALVNFLLRQQDIETAQRVIGDFLDATPEALNSQLLAGRVFTRAGQLQQARTFFDQALQQAPDNLPALLGLGQLDLMERSAPQAVERFEQAIATAPADQRAYMGLVTALEVQQSQSVVQRLEELAEQHAEHGTALAVLAQYQLRNRALEEALAATERSLNAAAATAYVYRSAAEVYRQAARQDLAQGELDSARSHAEQALELLPGDHAALAELAAIETAAGNSETAESLIQQLARLPQGQPRATLLQARLAMSTRQTDRARQLLEQRWQEHGEADIANNLYSLLQQVGDAQAAQALLDDWAARHGDDPRPLSHQATLAQAQGQTDQAITLYQRALERSPNSVLALNNLAWLYFESSNPEGLELARRAAELAPNNPAVLDTHGWLLSQSGDVEQGVEVLQRALQLAPDDAEIRQHLEAARAQLERS